MEKVADVNAMYIHVLAGRESLTPMVNKRIMWISISLNIIYPASSHSGQIRRGIVYFSFRVITLAKSVMVFSLEMRGRKMF